MPQTLWLLPAAAVLVLTVVAVTAVCLRYAARKVRFVVGPDGLRIRGTLRCIRLSRKELRVEEAQVLAGPAGWRFAPVMKIWGAGTPSLTLGWWRLENGQRAFVYTRSGAARVYVPTTRRYCVILTPTQPEQFLQDLRQGVPEEQIYALAESPRRRGLFPLAFGWRKGDNESSRLGGGGKPGNRT